MSNDFDPLREMRPDRVQPDVPAEPKSANAMILMDQEGACLERRFGVFEVS